MSKKLMDDETRKFFTKFAEEHPERVPDAIEVTALESGKAYKKGRKNGVALGLSIGGLIASAVYFFKNCVTINKKQPEEGS